MDKKFEITRNRLAQGTLLQALRGDPPPGMKIRSDLEMEQTLSDMLRDHDPAEDLHVFGYGSLMWNPAMDVAQSCLARVQGWHRRFCLRLLLARGTPEEPGAMLALDRGGACCGLLFRIEAHKVRTELQLLWRREMVTGSYDARWVTARVGENRIRALTFVVNRSQHRYIGGESMDSVARLIRTGKGTLGTSRAYFESTVQTLVGLGIHDLGIERMRKAVLRADARDAGKAR